MKQLYFNVSENERKQKLGLGDDLLNTLHCLIYEVMNCVQGNSALHSDFAGFSI